jgi:hypothetical protein
LNQPLALLKYAQAAINSVVVLFLARVLIRHKPGGSIGFLNGWMAASEDIGFSAADDSSRLIAVTRWTEFHCRFVTLQKPLYASFRSRTKHSTEPPMPRCWRNFSLSQPSQKLCQPTLLEKTQAAQQWLEQE